MQTSYSTVFATFGELSAEPAKAAMPAKLRVMRAQAGGVLDGAVHIGDLDQILHMCITNVSHSYQSTSQEIFTAVAMWSTSRIIA